jgi:hypothetical protein
MAQREVHGNNYHPAFEAVTPGRRRVFNSCRHRTHRPPRQAMPEAQSEGRR